MTDCLLGECARPRLCPTSCTATEKKSSPNDHTTFIIVTLLSVKVIFKTAEKFNEYNENIV